MTLTVYSVPSVNPVRMTLYRSPADVDCTFTMLEIGLLESCRDESNSSLPDFHWTLNIVIEESDDDHRTSSFCVSMLYTATAVGASGTEDCANAAGAFTKTATTDPNNTNATATPRHSNPPPQRLPTPPRFGARRRNPRLLRAQRLPDQREAIRSLKQRIPDALQHGDLEIGAHLEWLSATGFRDVNDAHGNLAGFVDAETLLK